MSEEQNVVVPEAEVQEEKVSLEEQINDLTDEERQMAEEQGLLKKDDEDGTSDKDTEKKSEPKKDDEEKQKTAITEDDYDTFDKVHDLYENNKEAFYSLPKSIKNQYHNAKGLYKKAKDTEERLKKLEDDGGYAKLQDSIARAKIERLGKRIAEAKADPENAGLTVEELEELIDLQKSETSDNKDRPMTVKDFEAMKEKEANDLNKRQQEEQKRQERVANKIQETEIYAKNKISGLTEGKYDKFEDVVTLAHEVAQTKTRFAKQIADVLNGEDSIEEVVDTIISIARINPKYGTDVTKNKIDIERMEKNAQKSKTSASLTAGKGGRVISYDDLTPEDAVKLSKDQWDKLPREVKKRLLMEV